MADFHDNITCPYCGTEDHEHCEYPRDLKGDGDVAEVECGECARLFFVTLCASYSYGSNTFEEVAAMKARQKQRAAEMAYDNARDRRDHDRGVCDYWQAVAYVHSTEARRWVDRLHTALRKHGAESVSS